MLIKFFWMNAQRCKYIFCLWTYCEKNNGGKKEFAGRLLGSVKHFRDSVSKCPHEEAIRPCSWGPILTGHRPVLQGHWTTSTSCAGSSIHAEYSCWPSKKAHLEGAGQWSVITVETDRRTVTSGCHLALQTRERLGSGSILLITRLHVSFQAGKWSVFFQRSCFHAVVLCVIASDPCC